MIGLSHLVKGQREVKKIAVNRGERSYEAQVDDEDYEFLSQYRWCFSGSSRTADANTSIWTEDGYKCVRMHQMVVGDAQEEWNLPNGVFPLEVELPNGKIVYIIPDRYRRFRTMSVDHIDGNGLNNTRANLRHLSCVEQARNRRR
jgi:hypothetical protein